MHEALSLRRLHQPTARSTEIIMMPPRRRRLEAASAAAAAAAATKHTRLMQIAPSTHSITGDNAFQVESTASAFEARSRLNSLCKLRAVFFDFEDALDSPSTHLSRGGGIGICACDLVIFIPHPPPDETLSRNFSLIVLHFMMPKSLRCGEDYRFAGF
jgi:hypothetical protein